ncbi:putative UDP-rhamnose:rhamnosyltransferase 1 [Malania oleifera]|uniref:putative UDP-rhamnose:rhamnosyltransferase 1 n=1 Tax=Malania oleifera TaxID=397392 RepID=UPI0025AE205E|nr:putative UDP-rhamnose:rhamnosyltransferase 1 [Malania oleifera]
MASPLHVVMLPWSAFGHMIPFHQLAIALAEAGVHVSFVSTPRNIQRFPKLPPHLSSLISFVQFPLPTLGDEHQLPEGAEATVDIPAEKIQYLKVAYDLLQHPFRQFVAESLPDWIIIEFSAYWAAEIAREHQIPIIHFSVFSAATRTFGGTPEYLVGEGQRRLRPSPESLTSPPEWVTFPSPVAFHNYEAIGFHASFFGQNASGITDAERVAKTLSACQALAIRSCNEYEGEYLDLLQKTVQKPVIPVGLLPPEIKDTEGDWSEISKWLNEQEPRSVVFVGFGSECKLSKDQVYEIAYGLELSDLPFLWALRKPSWAATDLDPLPPGFSHRTSKKGTVLMAWAPQLQILAHTSIGGSLFHGGWGSIVETLQFGHCLVVLPFILDQGLNARLLVNKGLAVEVERQKDGSFTREDIASSLRLAMASPEGEPLRVRAREAAAVFGNHKLHRDHYINCFVQHLQSGARK